MTPMKQPRNRPCRRSGVILICVLVCVVIVSGVVASGLRASLMSRNMHRTEHRQLQVQFLAEAGSIRAVSKLQTEPSYAGETWAPKISKNGDVVSIVIQVNRNPTNVATSVTVQARLADPLSETNGIQRTIQFPIPSANH